MEADRGGHRATLSDGEELKLEIFGYRTHHVRFAACGLGYLLSCGFLLLLFYWKPEWNVWANCVPCSLQEADVILLRTMDDFKKYIRKKVRWTNLTSKGDTLKRRSTDHRLIADEDSIMNKAIAKPALKVRFIQVQKIKYAWIDSEKKFLKIGELEDSFSCADIHSRYGSGLSSEEQDTRKLICGPNTIEIEVAPIWKLFIKEVLNLFYVHQFFTLSLWLAEGYYEFASVILFISFISICLTLYELRQQSVRLHNLVETHNKVSVTVCRSDGGRQEMESRHLVPGDVIAVAGKKLYMPFDAVLTSGSCVVNEGMLTGESIPVTKTHLPSDGSCAPWKTHSGEDYKRHVLFCGTEVILAKPVGRGPVKAVVLRTGFNTAKGDLVRSILYPRPMNFKLHRDAVRFFLFIGCLGIAGTVYSVTIAAVNGSPINRLIIDAILVLTAAFSPAIPAALATGIITAQRRLKRGGIFCISPQRINISGQVNLICFDKTGTLTEDGMDVWGFVQTRDNCFQKVRRYSPNDVLPWGPLLGAMASCHSLIFLDGELQGDPLELKMFHATGWVIEDSIKQTGPEDDSESKIVIKPGPAMASMVPVPGIAIMHQYPFSSSLQRMSVVTQVTGQSAFDVYMKGAPEKVASFCKQGTVPTNFSEELEFYTCQGFRVIGLAFKTLPGTDVESLTREYVESDLEFLGLLILENKLKKETKAVLQELNTAKIRTVMITGDNLQTAVTVAKHSAMISSGSRIILVEASVPTDKSTASITWRELEENPQNAHNGTEIKLAIEREGSITSDCRDYHFAMDGRSYQTLLLHCHSLLQKVLMNGTIFARMAPAQKSSLIEEFQKMSYFVAMCGDGANDCGALKMAHAGISLSEQEASVASPFTSKTDNIQCVAELIKQGRAALVTSFCLFKYMVLYGLVVYTAVLILYWRGGYYGNYQFLVQDLAITLPVFMTMSLNAAYPKLAPYRPPGHLFSPPILLSVVWNIFFSLCMQIYGYFMVQKQSWYNATNINSACVTANETVDVPDPFSQTISNAFRSHQTYENTTLWLLSTGNLLILAFVFSRGRPFRKPVYTNYPFLCVLLAYTGLCFFFIFADIHSFYKVLELVCTPTMWRVHVVIVLIVHFSVTYTVEEAILGNRALWNWLKARFPLQPLSLYKSLRHIVEVDPNWPPTNRPLDPFPVTMSMEDGIEMYANPAALDREHVHSGGYEQRKPPQEQYMNGHIH